MWLKSNSLYKARLEALRMAYSVNETNDNKRTTEKIIADAEQYLTFLLAK